MSGAPKKHQSERELKTARTLNTVATIGAGHALYTSVPKKWKEKTPGFQRLVDSGWVNKPQEHKVPLPPKVKALTHKIPNLKGAAKAGAAVSAGGWLGLHGAELAGDVMARRSINAQLNTKQSKVNSVSKNDMTMISKAKGDVRANGRGKNLAKIKWCDECGMPENKCTCGHMSKAFRQNGKSTPETVFVPGYGWVNGKIKRRPATKEEKLGGAIVGGAYGGIAGGSLGYTFNSHLPRGKRNAMIAAGLATGGALGSALGHVGNRYTEEFHPDSKKHKGAKHRPMGQYLTATQQAQQAKDVKYLANSQRNKDFEDLMGVRKADDSRKYVPGTLGAGIGLGMAAHHGSKGRQMHQISRQLADKKPASMAEMLVNSSGAGLAERSARRSFKRAGAWGALGAAGVAEMEIARRGKHPRLKEVKKAVRRYDSEADRQRRIGMYAAGGGAGAVFLGDKARANFSTKAKLGSSDVRGIVAKPGKGKKGALLGLGALASGTLGAGAYKRGVDVRNQPYT